MARDVTLMLTDEQYAAVLYSATARSETVPARMLAWLEPALDDAIRQFHSARWERRRRTLDANAALAAIVDDAAQGQQGPRGA